MERGSEEDVTPGVHTGSRNFSRSGSAGVLTIYSRNLSKREAHYVDAYAFEDTGLYVYRPVYVYRPEAMLAGPSICVDRMPI